MKKQFLKYSLFLLASVTAVSSCNRLLDASDPSKISESDALNNLSSINKINLGFYPAVPATLNWYAQSLITDELVLNVADNLGGGKMYYGWDYGPGTIEDRDSNMGLFRGYYNTIRRANITINNVDALDASTPADISKKNLYKAEALGMRAYSHFQVLQLFSPKYNPTALGCAYVTTVDDTVYPSRDNMQISYEKVLKDIDDALAIYPSDLDNNNTRMNKGALESLKAKVYFETGNYPKAIEFATIVLGKYSLTSAATYPNVWADTNDYKEVIFKQSNLLSAGATPGVLFVNTQDAVQYNASATLLSKYDKSDVRYSLFQSFQNKGIIPLKYLKPSFDNVKPVRGRADIKLIRTAEILLIRAESYAKNGDLTSAFKDYKTLRDARNAGVSEVFVNKQDAIDKISDERARELCYEGFRLLDLKRLDKTVQRIAADSRPGFTTLTFTDVNKFTLPIPQAEIFANKNIQQNVGW